MCSVYLVDSLEEMQNSLQKWVASHLKSGCLLLEALFEATTIAFVRIVRVSRAAQLDFGSRQSSKSLWWNEEELLEVHRLGQLDAPHFHQHIHIDESIRDARMCRKGDRHESI